MSEWLLGGLLFIPEFSQPLLMSVFGAQNPGHHPVALPQK